MLNKYICLTRAEGQPEGLFFSFLGCPIREAIIRREFDGMIQKLGLSIVDYGFHLAKRGAATSALLRGVSRREVQRRGHWRSDRMVSVYFRP